MKKFFSNLFKWWKREQSLEVEEKPLYWEGEFFFRVRPFYDGSIHYCIEYSKDKMFWTSIIRPKLRGSRLDERIEWVEVLETESTLLDLAREYKQDPTKLRDYIKWTKKKAEVWQEEINESKQKLLERKQTII